jgi:hypothetical protein
LNSDAGARSSQPFSCACFINPASGWAGADAMFPPMVEEQYASAVEAATPAMMTTLLLADRFKPDSATAGLMVGRTALRFWVTLPMIWRRG